MFITIKYCTSEVKSKSFSKRMATEHRRTDDIPHSKRAIWNNLPACLRV